MSSKEPGQPTHMCRLAWVFVVQIWESVGFLSVGLGLLYIIPLGTIFCSCFVVARLHWCVHVSAFFLIRRHTIVAGIMVSC